MRLETKELETKWDLKSFFIQILCYSWVSLFVLIVVRNYIDILTDKLQVKLS